jgi:cytolysin (calcineurin-like family phosphatase)
MSLAPTVYGFADTDSVEDAIAARVNSIKANNKGEVRALLGEAIAALNEINQTIPVHNKNRHLVAPALELFANGPKA